MRVGVIIPAYNEADSLPRMLADIPRQCVDMIVGVDNASTDATADVARPH